MAANIDMSEHNGHGLSLTDRLAINVSRPVGNVEWHSCSGTTDPRIQCGTIVVPLNYFNASDGTAIIALAKYKADPDIRRGSVFTNPGGPGGPGQMVALLGESLAASKIGPYYDIIGFDPRGIGETIPKVQCFKSRASKDQFYRNTVFELGYTQPPNATTDPNAFYDIVAQQRQALALFETQAKLCAENMPNGGAEMKYMGTSSVARDINFMTTVLDGPDAMINFWAQSYGSILGAYLFNMFPDRIGRGMIEAIVNPVIWTGQHSHQWMDNWLQSSDQAYTWFLDSCAKAGEVRCALAEGNATSDSIRKRIESFIEEVYARPMASPNSIVPAYLTAGAVRSSLYNTLLFTATWSDFASRLQNAMHGKPELLLDQMLPDPSRDPFDKAELARYAITCADALPFSGLSSFPTPESLARNTISRIKKVSRDFGGSPGTTDIDGGCQFWPVGSVERFAGPWNKTLANPIVIVASKVDPITPLSSAQLVHKLLGNSSRLIIVNSPGHGVRLPSMCRIQASLAYFVNGTLPPSELECEPEYGPFEEPEAKLASLSKADQVLIDASEKVIAGFAMIPGLLR